MPILWKPVGSLVIIPTPNYHRHNSDYIFAFENNAIYETRKLIFFFFTGDKSIALIPNYEVYSIAKTFHFIVVPDILILHQRHYREWRIALSGSHLKVLEGANSLSQRQHAFHPPTGSPSGYSGTPKKRPLKFGPNYITARWHVNTAIPELLNDCKEFSLKEFLSRITPCLTWSRLNVGLGMDARIEDPCSRTGVGPRALAQHPAWRRHLASKSWRHEWLPDCLSLEEMMSQQDKRGQVQTKGWRTPPLDHKLEASHKWFKQRMIYGHQVENWPCLAKSRWKLAPNQHNIGVFDSRAQKGPCGRMISQQIPKVSPLSEHFF